MIAILGGFLYVGLNWAAAPGRGVPTVVALPSPSVVVTPLPSPSPIVEQTYIVQNGDTPAAIADQFNVSPDALLRENNITDPRTLRVGQVLKIPAAPQRR
jgi:LysM repeat protein